MQLLCDCWVQKISITTCVNQNTHITVLDRAHDPQGSRFVVSLHRINVHRVGPRGPLRAAIDRSRLQLLHLVSVTQQPLFALMADHPLLRAVITKSQASPFGLLCLGYQN